MDIEIFQGEEFSMQPNEVIICLSQMTAKKGKEEQLRKALQALIQPTLQEKGCLAYELWQDHANLASFIMYERFINREALDHHVKMPHIEHFVKNEYATCVESHWDADFRCLNSLQKLG